MNPQQFSKLQAKALLYRSDSAKDRIQRLEKITSWLKKNESEVLKALYADFSKPTFETTLTELIPVYSEIKFFTRHLKAWMQDHVVPTPISLLGHKSIIRYENKGVVLIISPWNYPFYLAITPLIAALAAGNTAVIKPSELTPHTSNVILKLVQDCFTEDEVLVVLGDKTATENLLSYHFDHCFFTGSTAVGRLIAKACAEKLIPTTLELGGKSPTLIDETADLNLAAEKIFWGKFLNRGQTCVAPDYVVVHKSKYSEFSKKINALSEKYKQEIEGQIISKSHEQRLEKMAHVSEGSFKENSLIVTAPKDLNDSTMKEEIFGPILPILTYTTELEIKEILRTYEKPLSFYIFSKNKDFIERMLKTFPSGGVGINTVIMQLANSNLPFGGVGASGMGKYHGWHGFIELSHHRAIIKLNFFKGLSRFILPPYSPFKLKVIQWLK